MIGAALLSGLSGGIAGGLVLRAAWRAPAAARGRVAAGWAIVMLATLAGALFGGVAIGSAAALAAASVGVLLVVAQGRVRRAMRAPRDRAPEPLGGRSRLGRGVARALLAGPLSFAAAFAVAAVWAAWAPGDARTRVMVAGLILPLAWAAAIAWALADQRLTRAGAGLTGVALAALGAAWLGSAA